jgi:predicted DsbA family dithiol-disulfide isomerase/uncharacterized membrane protein
MRKTIWLSGLTVVLAALALVASAVLLVDYVRPVPVFCDVNGGCEAVKRSLFARPLGIPMPALGIAGMLGIGLASLVPGRVARIAQMTLAAFGALVAMALLIVQAQMGVLCPFCAIVDGAALALAVTSFLRLRFGWDPPSGRIVPGTAALVLVAAIGIPIAIGSQRKPPPIVAEGVPPAIVEEMRRTDAGKVTVVDFVDFECPFCRMTHTELAPLLEKRKDKVRVARKHVPLRMHAHATDAARAGCCGESLGKGDEMADALFRAPVEELTPVGCEKLAKEQGIDIERFRACVSDPATAARIEKDREVFRATKGHGLPTIWVDGTKLEGAQEGPQLAAVLDEAIRVHQSRTPLR